MAPEPTEHRKQCRRYNEPYHAHYLTFSCYRRQPLFTGPNGPRWFLDSLAAARAAEGFDLWAYVVMPEHVHLLIAPGEGYDVGRILRRIKGPFAQRVIGYVRRHSPAFLDRLADRGPRGEVTYRFWQPGGGYDRNLWTPRRIHEKVRYMHENPVRRGLVERAQDWPWSSFRPWTQASDEPLAIDAHTFPLLGP